MCVRTRPVAWRLAAASCLLVGASPVAGAASGLMPLAPDALPLAVRDGRVAQVTVHAVPFALGSRALDALTATALDAFLAGAATDCFLFAQAIGHVLPGQQGDGDTLAAHRLARARSETVASALLHAGLPADSVTSVWDHQFASREPRVTLWVFARPAGEDCDGTSLPGAPTRVAAVSDQAAPLPTAGAAPSEASGEPAPGIQPPDIPPPSGSRLVASPEVPSAPHRSTIDVGAPGGGAANLQAVPPAPWERSASAELEPAPGIHLSGLRPEEGPTAHLELSAPSVDGSPAATTVSVAVVAAAVQPEPDLARDLLPAPSTAADAEPKAGPSITSQAGAPPMIQQDSLPSVEIVFDPDSSYFSGGAVPKLAGLVASLPRDASWALEVQAAVGDEAGGLPAERAVAYNRWLADRRQGRVEGWLAGQAAVPAIEVRRSLLPHDPSRRVVITARPLH